MAQWDNGVSPPAGGSYSGSLVKLGQIADWGPDDPQKLRQEQEAKAFQQGLPIDPRTGQTDFRSVGATALKYGVPSVSECRIEKPKAVQAVRSVNSPSSVRVYRIQACRRCCPQAVQAPR
jgi:hypothetical protein